MFSKFSQRSLWLIGLLLAISVAIFMKGCDRENGKGPSAPPGGARQSGVGMRLSAAPEMQAKAVGVTIAAVALDELGNPTNVMTVPVAISNPVFPLDVPLTLFTPPCDWRIVVTVALSRDRPRIKSVDIDACHSVEIDLPLDTFETMHIPSGSDPLQVPESAQAGETIVASCGGVSIDAPDSDSHPLVATLSEHAGRSVSGPLESQDSVSGSFPDPYELLSPEEQRVFRCTISDGRSPAQSFRKAVRRILPTPTVSPTLTPTPDITPSPDATPTPEGTPSPTPTPTPTPDPCEVQNNNDSGAGSLRQVLMNGCSTITFAPGVSTITLTSGQLTVPSGNLTINGGGVTVDGNNSFRVFYVNSGANVTFQGLTITNGSSDYGGGIYNRGTVTINGTVRNNTASVNGGGIHNDGGTIIIASGATVRDNMSNGTGGWQGGGGIHSYGGTVTVNGAISNNTATHDGGGIFNDGGAVSVNGTISGNTANTYNGGGIISRGGTITINGTVSSNNAIRGGGIAIWDSTLSVNGTISGNNASIAGGGIYQYNSTVNGATTSTVYGNTASSCNNYYNASGPVCVLP